MAAGMRLWCWTLVVLCLEMAQAADGSCYAGGDIAGAVLGTFFATLLMVALVYYFYTFHWKNRRDKHPVLVGDPENVKDEFAFDNPGFKTMEGQQGAGLPRPGAAWSRMNVANEKHTDSRTFLDDTYPEGNRGSKMVPLWSKDFTGLGFEISGSMRDGIYVSRVLRGGPAHECGQIRTGDRINSVRISFRNMVYEDALSILSFASPYELQLEVQPPTNSSSNAKDMQSRLSAILSGNASIQRSPGSTMQIMGDKSKKNPGYDSLDKNWKSGGVEIRHPILGIKRPRCNSNGDVSTLEKSTRQYHFSQPNSANSTLDASNPSKNTSLKKMLTDKIINSSTLEKSSKPPPAPAVTTNKQENERNAKNKLPEQQQHDVMPKPERVKVTQNNGVKPDVVIIKDGGDMYSVKNEKAETQRKEAPDAAKKGMKFGIRVLPPNVPDDGTLLKSPTRTYENVKFGGENGSVVVAEIRSIDEVDKSPSPSPAKPAAVAPVVAKRREKPVAPIPNARVSSQITTSTNASVDIADEFHRNSDLNSSGIKRDSQGIPQEIPQHMMEAAMFARSNRKSTAALNDVNDSSLATQADTSAASADSSMKNAKKSKGKAPSPPEAMKNGDDSIPNDEESFRNAQEIKNNLPTEVAAKDTMNFTDNFTESNSVIIPTKHHDQKHATQVNRSDDMILNNALLNSSTPKVEKVVKRMRPDPPIQKLAADDSIDNTMNDSKRFMNKEISESLNNYFDDSKSTDESMVDSVKSGDDSFASNQKEKLIQTTIELNSTDVLIHNSSTTDSESQDDNERKASSLGDLSKLEVEKNNAAKISSQGTLERAQSLDISSEEAVVKDKHVVAKKRKSNSVFDGDYSNEANGTMPMDSDENVNQILIHSKEPRLSLDIGSLSPSEGLNTFQKNRLKKASEWGNLEDAIILKKDGLGSSNSGSSEITNSRENLNDSNGNLFAQAKHEDKIDVSIEENKSMPKSTTTTSRIVSNGDSDVVDISDISLTEIQKTDRHSNNSNLNFNLPKMTIENILTRDSVSSDKVKPEPPIRSKIGTEAVTNEQTNYEIGKYSPEAMGMYSENVRTSSGNISPKIEEKLTMIYDTNIPDDIKVSRHTLVSSLERPKSDLMKKLLAQNPALTSDIEASLSTNQKLVDDEIMVRNNNENTQINHPDVCNDRNNELKTSSTLTLINQPDIVNLRIKPNTSSDNDIGEIKHPDDYVSNINIVGSTPKTERISENAEHNNFVTNNDMVTPRNFFTTSDNVVTISTDGSQPSSIITIESDSVNPNIVEKYRNSIEINADQIQAPNEDIIAANEQTERGLYNEILSELKKSNHAFVDSNNAAHSVVSSSKTYLMDYGMNDVESASKFSIDAKPVILTNETTTVDVTEDNEGHQIITQTIETVTITTSAVEMEGEKINDEMNRIKAITEKNDHRIVDDKTIMKDDYSRQISVNSMNEDRANNKNKEFSHSVEDMHRGMNETNYVNGSQYIIDEMPIIAMRQTTFKFIDDSQADIESEEPELKTNTETIKHNNDSDKHMSREANYKIDFNGSQSPKEYITEIQVSTPASDKMQKRNSDAGGTRLMNDFLDNERSFSHDEKTDSEKFVRRKSEQSDRSESNDEQKNKRHSDFDLPRNAHIKFRTATYEPQNPPPNRLSLEKRLSQIEILKSNFERGVADAATSPTSPRPSLLSKPSSIPVKLPEKPTSPHRMPTISPSKIPVFNSQSQKSASQENLLEGKNNVGSQKATPNNKLSSSSGNISITSIKSSSRNPSGK